jgi:hypothetical protein
MQWVARGLKACRFATDVAVLGGAVIIPASPRRRMRGPGSWVQQSAHHHAKHHGKKGFLDGASVPTYIGRRLGGCQGCAMHRQGRGELGEGRAGLIIALIIVVFAIFAAIKFVPVYVGGYDLKETIRDEARMASRADDEHITARILEKAAEHELPMNESNVGIRRTHNKITVNVTFDAPIDLAVFTWDYHFEHSETAPLF